MRAPVSRRTGGTDTPVSVCAFSAATGEAARPVSTGASLRACTALPSSTGADHVPCALTAWRRSTAAPKETGESAIRTVKAPG